IIPSGGSIDLGGATLSATLGFVPTTGSSVRIIDNQNGSGGLTGTFAGLPEGAAVNFGGFVGTIDYTGGTGNDVVLTFAPAPEPAGLLGLGAAAVGAVGLLRRRRWRPPFFRPRGEALEDR